MSFFLAPALRRLFHPKPIPHDAASAAPADQAVIGISDMELPNDANTDFDEIDALDAAVSLHETVNAMERSTYEARLRGTMDDLLKRLDTKRNG